MAAGRVLSAADLAFEQLSQIIEPVRATITGLLLAVLTTELPQLRAFTRICSLPLYLLSGVMLPLHAAPPEWRAWLLLNPVLSLVEYSRHCFFAQYPLLPGIGLSYPLAAAALMAALGMAGYRLRRERLVAV